VLRNRPGTHPLAGNFKNRITNRGQDRRKRGLAETHGRVCRLDEVDFDLRGRLRHAHRGILVGGQPYRIFLLTCYHGLMIPLQ
jgi:hypothetical protein